MAGKGINLNILGLNESLNNDNELEEYIMSLVSVLKQARRALDRIEKSKVITKDADGDDDGGKDELMVKRAHAHLKACDALHEAADEHREEAIKCLKKCLSKSMDDSDEEDKSEDEGDEEDKKPEDDKEPEAEDKSDDDEEEDPEDKKAIARIRARARARV
jgi:hypothetical protein